jgi:hypothetical protein
MLVRGSRDLRRVTSAPAAEPALATTS